MSQSLNPDPVQTSRSAKTDESYRHFWRRFEQWCEKEGRTPLPADADTLVDFFRESAGQLKLPSLNMARSAIAREHVSRGYSLDIKNRRFIDTWNLIKGRNNASGSSRKAPIRHSDLLAIISKLGTTKSDLRDRALLLLGYNLALEPTELVHLKVEDFLITRDGATVKVRGSKMGHRSNVYDVSLPQRGTGFAPSRQSRRI